MRRLVIVYDDAVFETLKNAKNASGMTWERFILYKCLGKKAGK